MRKLILTVDLNVLNEEKEILKAQDTTTVVATILENNEPANLEGLIGKVIFTKPDGTVVFQDSDITIEENIVTTKLLPECLEMSGKNAKLEIEFRNSDDEIISTFRIPIEIEPTGKECELSKKSSSYAEKIEKELKRLDDVKADRTELPKKTSELENDSNFAVDENYVHTDNNFTDTDKNKLDGLENYDDTNIKNDIKTLEIDLEETKADIGDIAIDVNNLEIEVSNLSDGINNIAEDVSRIDTKVNNIAENVEKNKTDILDIEENLNHLEDSKADRTEIPDVSEFIKKTVDNLVNYYKKTETYTQEEVNNLIGAIKTAHFEVVEKLPETGETNIIYLVPKESEKEDDIYDEYIYINRAYEFIGSTAVDLSNYYDKDEINTILFDYITSNDLEEILADYAKTEVLEGYVKNEKFDTLAEKVAEIELFKFPNVIIHGTPTINNGQVSDFSTANYLSFPAIFELHDRGFEFNFAVRTGSDITTAQNILGSNFCMALLIEGAKLKLRVSSNGTSWDLVDITGSIDVAANTNYYIQIYFDKLTYKLRYSLDGISYTDIASKVASVSPFARQIYLGIGNNFHNPFKGMINLNKCNLKVNNSVIWQGMDDAGLATRMAVDMENIDEAGKDKLAEIASDKGFVQNTDYATSAKVGVVKGSDYTGILVGPTGAIYCASIPFSSYQSKDGNYAISKGTLENVIAGKELVNKTQMEDYINSLDGNNISY